MRGTEYKGSETVDHGDQMVIKYVDVLLAGDDLRNHARNQITQERVNGYEDRTFYIWKHRAIFLSIIIIVKSHRDSAICC